MQKVKKIKCFTKDEATLITPAMALELLTKNKCPKTPKQTDIVRIAKDMSNGSYEWNGGSIVLDEDGNLVDGQTRLMACVTSKMPFHALVVWGVHSEGTRTIDTGRPRNVVQWLAKKGYQNPSLLSNAAKILKMFNDQDHLNAIYGMNLRYWTSTDIVKTIDENPGLQESVNFIKKYHRKIVLKSSVPLLAMLDYQTRFVEGRGDFANEFIEILAGEKDASALHPAKALRDKIVIELVSRGRVLARRREGALLVKAYNAFKKETVLRNFKMADDETPVIFVDKKRISK